MYVLYFEKRKCYKKTMLTDVREFVFEHHYKQIALIYKNRYYLLKKMEKRDLGLLAKK